MPSAVDSLYYNWLCAIMNDSLHHDWFKKKKKFTEREKSVTKISFQFYESEFTTVFNFPGYYIIPEPFFVCVYNLFCYCHILRQCLGGDTTDIVSLREEI